MTIRPCPILLLLATCTQTPADPPQAARVLPSISCEYRRYECDPSSSTSGMECTWACGVVAHCQEYTPQDVAFCAAHHDYFIDFTHYCDPLGNPSWDTYCVVDYIGTPPATGN